MMELEDKDIQQITRLGISREVLEKQLKLFKDGVKPIVLTAAATINDGIIRINQEQLNHFEKKFENQIEKILIAQFVPASGAASRMFKAFFQYLDNGIENDEVKSFATNYQSFAFYDIIKCKNEPDYSCAINNMINTLKLSDLPKALIPFHFYADGARTALEEHLVESALILGRKSTINLHFTISESHHPKFSTHIDSRIGKYTSKYNCEYNLTFSYQSHTTDTVAVLPDNQLFRNTDGSMVFRPGGHGSLLKNLNEVNSDLIFVKNIDNIQPDHLKASTIQYKKVLAGYLISLQEKIAVILQNIDNNIYELNETSEFIRNELCIKLPESFAILSEVEKAQHLHDKLNRPIRICGMVKNEGEPGGGPFWVSNSKGGESLQIVESSQIDLENPQQEEVIQQSTHFNPVDLVCWVRDYKGEKFDLKDYSDPDTAFITEKSQNGQTLKVLEHPGLWNGAMADWITLFVEVPISTFSPVKTITDLLRPQHQPA